MNGGMNNELAEVIVAKEILCVMPVGSHVEFKVDLRKNIKIADLAKLIKRAKGKRVARDWLPPLRKTTGPHDGKIVKYVCGWEDDKRLLIVAGVEAA